MNTVYNNIHQDIIERCIEGDVKAQFQLYKLYYKAMYNTSLRIVNDTMEAEDIMQDSFLAAFEKITSYKGEVSFGAWLKRIVINNSLDHLKKKKIELTSLDEKLVNIKAEEQDEQDIDIQKIKVEQIKKAINELADGYRIILSLYLLEGYDHEEIGEIMNISSSTSRSQYTRARKRLLDLLKDQDKNLSFNYQYIN